MNLNKVRKAKERADAKTRADENAVRFGRTKAEKTLDKAREEQKIARLDLHKRDRT